MRRGDVSVAEQAFNWVDPDFFRILPRRRSSPAIRPVPSSAPDALVLTRSAARKYFGRDAPIGETLLKSTAQPMRVAAVIEDLPTNSNITGDVFGSGARATIAW